MPSGCLVPGCTEKSRLGQSVSFHGLLVEDAQRCKLWLRAINNPRVGEDTGKEIIKGKTICSLHFKLEDFDGRLFGKIRSALKPTAVPSVCSMYFCAHCTTNCRHELPLKSMGQWVRSVVKMVAQSYSDVT
uniref:THAP-type domain-containing protein n=1 Tax=Gadus morhua TaxID=8049 RepID=A0A8C5AMZ6_GADMO